MPLTGERVFLRALETRDLDAIWEAYQDFDLQLTTDGDAPPVSDHQVRAFWKRRIKHPAPEMRYFAIEPLPEQPGAGRFAGMCNLHDIDMRNRHAELGIWIGFRDLRGLGYGTDAIRALLPYAFEVVRLEKLYLGVYDFNDAGLRCYERLGFRYEGRLRHQIYYAGQYWDEWPMRLLRSEWDLARQAPVDGLRLYHPADLDQVLVLLQQTSSASTVDAARATLRRWWRQTDRDMYSFQQDNKLGALLSVREDVTERSVVNLVVLEAYRQRLDEALADAGIVHQPA